MGKRGGVRVWQPGRHPEHIDFQAVRDGLCHLCLGPIWCKEWVRQDKRERICHADCLDEREQT